jgi:hypothetical protein
MLQLGDPQVDESKLANLCGEMRPDSDIEASWGRMVSCAPVANLPHKPAPSVTLFCEPQWLG